MARYPYILNRNGYYYFRMAVPLFHVNALGRRELVYSLKTKDYGQAKIRSSVLLQIAQEVFQFLQRGRADMAILHLEYSIRQISSQNNQTQTYGDMLSKPSFPTASTDCSNNIVGVNRQEGKKLCSIYDVYLDECKDNRPKTLRNKQAVIELWLDAVGDIFISDLDKGVAREFKKTLMNLPPNYKKTFRAKSLKDIDFSSIPPNKRLSIKSVNIQLGYMRSFINWSIQNGYYQGVNPFVGLALKEVVRAKEKRNPFSEEQINKIFSTPVYKGCLSEKLHDRFIKGSLVIKDGFYWIPLIALYSGARMQEICQLYVSDIREVNGVWCFDFNAEGGDKHLKNDSSRRKTPIHPYLIDQGLLDYYHLQNNNKKKRLFSDISLSCDGTYSNAFSKRFTHFLKRFNIKTNKTSFHSFRHNFIDALREAGVPREIRQALVGHLGIQSTHDNYGSQVGLKQLHNQISLVKFNIN